MALYEHDRDTLEDLMYCKLQDLWSPLTDAIKVFDDNGSAQPLRAQTAFPLDNKCMQTVWRAD